VQFTAKNKHKNAHLFLEAMRKVAHKQLFVTREGYFSSTMPGVLPGDRLVALNGSPILHVIRQVTVADGSQPETWKFVGEAYLPTPMHENKQDKDVQEIATGEGDEVATNAEATNTKVSDAEEGDVKEREFVFV
jgi:hypothetical protein